MNQHLTLHNTFGLISRRECSIIACLADGDTNKQIGEKTGLSEAAVQQYLHNLMIKQGVRHSYELISWAYMNGFLK